MYIKYKTDTNLSRSAIGWWNDGFVDLSVFIKIAMRNIE